MSERPDLRDLVGDGVPEDELARLGRVHELLLDVGPPPELSPGLAEPARPGASVSVLTRRRWGVLAIAAALGLFALLGGYVLGYQRGGFDTQFTLPLQGIGDARSATGSLEVGDPDRGGNSPMKLRVRGLQKLGPRGYYEVLLTREGARPARCGTFIVKGGTTTVYLNAPYEISSASEWVVAVHRTGHVENPPVVMRT